MSPIGVKVYGLLLGAALAAAGLPVGPEGLSSKAIVSYGHRGPVRGLASDVRRGLVFSVGDDGTLRVWDTASQTLMRRIAVSRLKAESIAVDPADPLAAILVTDGARSFSVDVWNWDTGRLLYRLPQEAAPLFVKFSLSGTYLLCGAMRWDGLRMYKARDGTEIPVAHQAGMVAFAEVSRSDSTLMSYLPSGRIEYRDLATGALIAGVDTAPDLIGVRASDDRRWLLGRTADEIVCLDAVTGATRLVLSSPGVISADISGSADRIAWVARDGLVHAWQARDGTTVSVTDRRDLGWQPRLVRFSGDDLLLAGSDGEMVRVAPSGHQTEMARDILAATSGFAAAPGLIALAAGDLIHVFRVGPRVDEWFSLPSPYPGGAVGLSFLDPQHLLVWSQGRDPGALGVIDCTARTCRTLPVTFAAPLLAVTVRDGRAFTLQQDGRIQVVSLDTGRQVLETSRPGAVCIAAIGPTTVVVGRARDNELSSSLVKIDLVTGETVSLPGSETYTYALDTDAFDGSLYSLGVDRDGRAKLFRHSGVDLQTESVIDSAPVDLSASLALDPSSRMLYSSLGRQRVTVWAGNALRTLGDPSPGIEVLRARAGLVSTLQRDSTVTVWDALTDRPVATIYPFADGNWAAILSDGSVQGSQGGIAKVSFFAQGRLQNRPGFPPPSQEQPVAP